MNRHILNYSFLVLHADIKIQIIRSLLTLLKKRPNRDERHVRVKLDLFCALRLAINLPGAYALEMYMLIIEAQEKLRMEECLCPQAQDPQSP